MSLTQDIDVPTKIYLFERDTTSLYPTDDQGCYICPSSIPKCPKCDDDEECILVSSSCKSCPTPRCEKKTGSTSSGKSVPVGGIVGGVLGGVALLLIIGGILYWKFLYKRRPPMYLDDDDIMMGDLKDEEDDYEYNDDENDSNENLKRSPSRFQETQVSRQPNPSRPSNRRVSSYESFTRPRARYARGNQGRARASAAAARRRQMKRVPSLNLNSDRNSIATSVSTTNASNILPIAYIPGVTVRPTKNNTKSIYSYDSESTMDWSALENASIVGDSAKANNQNHLDSTMVAIKAQPRLIDVDRIEEEDEDITDDENDTGMREDSFGTTANSSSDFIKNDESEFANMNATTLSDISDAEEVDDSDVDSDIGEIARATSVRRQGSQSQKDYTSQDREIVLDVHPDGDEQEPPHFTPVPVLRPQQTDDATLPDSGTGSFVLEVEVDDNNDPQYPQQTSPFEDPIDYKNTNIK
ncbi:uncharacterized protein PRCAT00001942001 [Priceomyces carsonii]|uniref:uncharacterized protein n=1 Tax=Priceomyces carsonii TaxID=28549 RepID=UPI002EDA641B|nr:unnamed protein product [Priceomyces carsonii]